MSFSTYLSFEVVVLVSASIYGVVAALREVLVLREEIMTRHEERERSKIRSEYQKNLQNIIAENRNRENE